MLVLMFIKNGRQLCNTHFHVFPLLECTKKWRHSSYYRDFAVFSLAPRFSWVLLISVFPTDGRKVGKSGILNPKHVCIHSKRPTFYKFFPCHNTDNRHLLFFVMYDVLIF